LSEVMLEVCRAVQALKPNTHRRRRRVSAVCTRTSAVVTQFTILQPME